MADVDVKFSRAFSRPPVCFLAVIEPERPYRRIVSDPCTVRSPEIVKPYFLIPPDIAGVCEKHDTEPSPGVRTEFGVEHRHAVAACWCLSVRARRADGILSISPYRVAAAGVKPLVQGHYKSISMR